ncbi:GGDEF domain-containing protein [Leptolyngbya sp. PCC 6406]|uniref:GGDEF domain-containing protein n=1 Tax=Leptolyngbya sp. PCC 6406 TaxID=1173264 RepID=UPI0002AD12CE|nr:GGDEF domain-containing protein [Leptolyngbya sp. PCC 6406]
MPFALMPHGYCFLWNRPLTLIHVLGDSAIAIAYFSIPTMMYLNRDRATEAIRPIIILFTLFILSCGIGHVFSAWNIWYGNYWLEGFWKLIIASISLWTAWVLVKTLPKFMGLHKHLQETELLALTDTLTGLKNRRGIEWAFEQIQATFADNSSLGHVLMLVDLDGFKGVNDTYGHATGDLVLKTVAHILCCRTRAVDTVGRFGGDEFAVILVGCSLVRSYQIAEDIRTAIAAITLPANSSSAPESCPQPPTPKASLVTASIGLLSLSANPKFDEAYNSADMALYRSKQEGRDRTTFITKPDPSESVLPAP